MKVKPYISHSELNKVRNNKNISISEVYFKHYFNIKFDRKIVYDQDIILEIEDIKIPNTYNKITYYDKDRLIWLSPYEWMYITNSDKFHNLCKSPKYEYIDDLKSIIDLSSAYTTIKLSGEYYINVLNKITTLDILENITSEYCAQSLISNIKTIIWMDNLTKGIFLTVNSSYSQYLFETILDASQEFI